MSNYDNELDTLRWGNLRHEQIKLLSLEMTQRHTCQHTFWGTTPHDFSASMHHAK